MWDVFLDLHAKKSILIFLLPNLFLFHLVDSAWINESIKLLFTRIFFSDLEIQFSTSEFFWNVCRLAFCLQIVSFNFTFIYLFFCLFHYSLQFEFLPWQAFKSIYFEEHAASYPSVFITGNYSIYFYLI